MDPGCKSVCPRRLQIDLDTWPCQLAGESRAVSSPPENPGNIGPDAWPIATYLPSNIKSFYVFVPESLLFLPFIRSSSHVRYKFMSSFIHLRLLPSALWRQTGSCKQVCWSLPLCSLVMLRCLNSTKIRRRWQCGAQCSGPCLRTAPVPLTPTRLGQPSAVFRSVYSTRHNRTQISMRVLCGCCTSADWGENIVHYSVKTIKESSNNLTNVHQQKRSNRVMQSPWQWICFAVLPAGLWRRPPVPDNVVWMDRQQHETDKRHHTSCTKALLHHGSGSGTCLLSSSADGGLCKSATESFHTAPPCFLKVKSRW